MIISITCPPKQLRTWEYYRQNRTIKLDFTRHQQQVLECFWKSDQKSTLITGFQTHNEHGTSGGSKPVHIGDLHMGLISHLHHAISYDKLHMFDTGMWGAHAWKLICAVYSCLKRERQAMLEWRSVLIL